MNGMAAAIVWLGAIASFTERGQIDFDVVLDALNPWGAWSAQDVHWTYQLFDARDAVPFARGYWAYTDFGWTWIGDSPASWATDHYGAWKLEEKGWAWHPDPLWHPAPVEFRQTKELIGWRPAKMTPDHQLVEPEAERFAHPEEWIWVKRAQFGAPITPEKVLTGEAAKALLIDSQPCSHTFIAWREIERPGPAPEEILPADRIVAEEVRKENQPSVKADRILMLSDLWQEHPQAKTGEIYLYRPDFYQDSDGIERRIGKWIHPESAAQERQQVDEALKDSQASKAQKQ